jgi:glutathione S-transferase
MNKQAMKVYGHRGSICTNRVLFTFAEKGVEPELVPVDLARGQQKAPEHVARHPFGMIPVLEDGDDSLYESRAIMRYLDQVLPGPRLAPEGARALAEMERWISVEYSYLSPPVGEIVKQKFVVPAQGGTADAAAIDRARQSLSRVLGVVDGALRERPYLAGDSFTLADVSTAPVVSMLLVARETAAIEAHPHVAAWWSRLSTRPAWRRVTGDAR